jgi:IS5 family transposase
MKAHVGVDAGSGVTRSLETSTARVQDSQVRDALLHGEETSVRADKGYVSAEGEAAFTDEGKV